MFICVLQKDHKQQGLTNLSFVDEPHNGKAYFFDNSASFDVQVAEPAGKEQTRVTWNNSIEFLMSCIAVSVGFGNIWRFPFTAYENGGGAFLIPYVIVLFLVGKPFYFLEMILGQFSSKSSVKVWAMSPGFTGNSPFCTTFRE